MTKSPDPCDEPFFYLSGGAGANSQRPLGVGSLGAQGCWRNIAISLIDRLTSEIVRSFGKVALFSKTEQIVDGNKVQATRDGRS